MREMMFDVVKLGAQVSLWQVEDAGEFIFQISHSRGVCEPVLGLAKDAQARRRIQNLFVQVRGRIARNADVVHVFEPHAGRFQTISDRLLGKARAVLDAIEAFFFDCGDQSAVFDDCRRSIAVIRVDAENVHRESSR